MLVSLKLEFDPIMSKLIDSEVSFFKNDINE